MAKNNNTTVPEINLVIEKETEKISVEKTVEHSVLNINCDNKTDKALRVYRDNGEHAFYCSSRLNTLTTTTNGYKADVTGLEKEIIGKNYEICEVTDKSIVMKGRIVEKAAASEKVINIKISAQQ